MPFDGTFFGIDPEDWIQFFRGIQPFEVIDETFRFTEGQCFQDAHGGVPPAQLQAFGNKFFGDAETYWPRWYAGDDFIRADIACDDGPCGNDGAVSNGDTAHDDGVVANPHVVADDWRRFVACGVGMFENRIG